MEPPKRRLPPIANILIERCGDDGHPGILYFSPQLKTYVFVINVDGEKRIIKEKNPMTINKIMRKSWDELNITFFYPNTFSDKKRKKLNKLLGSTSSRNQVKARLNGFIQLLIDD